MKEHNYALQNAETRPRLQSRTQNICLVISISAFILKLMVKITSIFGSYRYLRIAWYDIVSLSHHLPASTPRAVSQSEEQMLIFSSSLTPGRVKGSWKTPACLKFGKISNRALSQRKLWVWTANSNFLVFLLKFFVAQYILVKSGAVSSGKLQCIVVKSCEFENSSHLIYFS